MTDIKTDKELNKPSISRDFRPEISKLAEKKAVSLIPSIAIGIGIILLLLAFFYISFKRGNENNSNNIDKTKLKPEIIKKEFSFKKNREEVDLHTEEMSAEPINKSESLPSKPIFSKYKSIPVKSNAVTENSANNTQEVQKGNEVQKEASETAIIADKITIDPNFLIPEGTYIPCSLTNRFTSDVTGRITCTIAQDVYSANGMVKLIEKGTKAIGSYQGGNLKQGMGRMFVIWTKLITPDFKRINLVDTQVVGSLGETGIDGRIDSHFFKRFGGALMVSAIKDIVNITQQRLQKKENNTTVNINNIDNTKDATISIVEKMLQDSINIAPTMYKNQGDIVGILVGRDIDFSKIYKLKIRK